MPTKEEALTYVTSLGEQGIVTSDELNQAYNKGRSGPVVMRGDGYMKKLSVADIFYYIGGGIVLLGIIILLEQNWGTLGFATKVLVTFGAGVACYIVGVVYSHDPRTAPASTVFHLLGGFVIPIGLFVIFDHAGIDVGTYGFQTIMSLVLFIMYLLSFRLFKKNVFIGFCLLFGTWFFFSITSYLVGQSGTYLDSWQFYEYRFLFAGLAYLLMGHAFSTSTRESLTGVLYSFGIIFFLGAALSLGGWNAGEHPVWDLLFPVFTFATLFGSVYLKSKSFLTFGTIFLMIYIFKMTAEYFSNNLGWPLALVIAGLAMIGAGMFSFYLRKKYIPNGAQ